MPQTRKFQKTGSFHVYMLQCKDGSFYTGYTNNLEKRLKLHRSGKGAKYTRSHRPLKLVWTKKFSYYRSAFKEETRIKKLNRKQKEKMVSHFRNITKK